MMNPETSALWSGGREEPLVLVASAPLGNRWSDQQDRHYLHQMPASLHPRLTAYRNWADKQRSIIGRLLLAKLLQEYRFPGEALAQIKTGRYGKPYAEFGLHFNIAHAAGRIVCSASRTVQVGIDIELIKPIDFSDFESVMSPDQWRQIADSSDSVTEFWRLWTVKEAIAKADGRGIGLPLDTISVESSVATLGQNRWYLTALDRWPDYCCYLASDQILHSNHISFADYYFD